MKDLDIIKQIEKELNVEFAVTRSLHSKKISLSNDLGMFPYNSMR
jgi:hypothetical protein